MLLVKAHICVLGIVLTLVACTPKAARVDVSKKLDHQDIKCIAIPSFNNLSSRNTRAGSIVSDLIGVELFKQQGIDALQRTEVDTALRSQNINLNKSISVPEAVWLGSIVGADAVLLGTIAEYGYQYDGEMPVGNPTVALNAKIVTTKTKELVWSAYIERSGKDALQGKRDPLSRVAMLAVKDLLASIRFGDGSGESGKCPAPKISLDIDGDGILNLADQCPMRPELVNGIEDSDGCPELSQNRAEYVEFFAIDGDRILLKQPVEFEQLIIDASSHALLRELANFLIKNPEIRKVMIEGFTASDDKQRFKERTAFQRASKVKQFLILQGVEEARLVAVGYGFEPKRQSGLIELTIVE